MLSANAEGLKKMSRGVWKYDNKGSATKVERAAPELLRSDLRILPSDYVTKDEAEADKIHELDPPHIQEALQYEMEKPAPEEDEFEKAKEALRGCTKLGEKRGFRNVQDKQLEVDAVRMRIINARIQSLCKLAERGMPIEDEDFNVQHVWFPDRNNINRYELRDGNPPSDSGRPRHLKKLDLVIDITELPARIKDILKIGNINLPKVDRRDQKPRLDLML